MALSKFRALFPTIIFILVCVLVSMVVLNFFQVDMNDNNGFRVLNRVLTVEGMKTGNGKEPDKKEGMCNAGIHQEGMCGGMNCEGMLGKTEKKDLVTISASPSNLMN